jgi:SpoVK/Ycf46/Vps4 family AAA+-type ATPase
MLAMALSSMARMPCLLVTPSVLLRKYVGETNQQCRTLFSLAQKLSPCILCIDELDGLFRKRSDNEHEVSRDLKTEFLQNWEGMLSRPVRNLIVAATNRPFDVDEAVLRRFSQSHLVGLPDVTMRTLYLRGLIQEIPTTNDVDASQLAIQTEGYTPSDLRRLLQTAAALGPLRESASQPRPLSTADIQRAIQMVPSTFLSGDYRQALSHFIRSNQPAPESALPNRYLPHGSDGSSSVMYEDEDGRWETEWGNFYNLGSLQVDTPTFDVLSSIVERLNDMAEEEFFDMDGDGEDDYSPDDAEDGH